LGWKYLYSMLLRGLTFVRKDACSPEER